MLIQTLLVPHFRPSTQLKFNVLEQATTCCLLDQVKRSPSGNWNGATADHAQTSKRQATSLLHHSIARWHDTNSSRNIIMAPMSLAWEMQGSSEFIVCDNNDWFRFFACSDKPFNNTIMRWEMIRWLLVWSKTPKSD